MMKGGRTRSAFSRRMAWPASWAVCWLVSSANPDMLQYIGTRQKRAPGVNVTGLLYGNPSQLLLQFYGAAFHHRVQHHRKPTSSSR